jgi:glycosyltransferase involved in cell wall biosynthesis
MATLRSATVRTRMLRHRQLNACIQFGSEYRLPSRVQYATYDDATIQQLWREYPYEWMQCVPAAELHQMIDRQRKIFAGAVRCCLSNHWAAASAMADYGIPRERVVVTGEAAPPLQVRHAHDWSVPRFLFVGKDWTRKNGEGVMRAFARVLEERPEAELDVVGGHPRLDFPHVSGHGMLAADDPAAQARLDNLFARATCLVVPSLLEPAARVFAQALQAGIPSIGGTAGGSATIIGDAGLVVDGTDGCALTRAMLHMCDQHVLMAYAASARDRASLFTWRAVAERVVRALDLPGLDVSNFAVGL